MKSLDTETTGLDLRHGAKPFFVTTCDDFDNLLYWEADVDPFTREPQWAKEDLEAIDAAIADEDILVLQNPKFDKGALDTIGQFTWDWSKVCDTLLAGHLLASNQPHDLTTMAVVYAGVNITPYEKELEIACKDARTLARSKDFQSRHGVWRIAKEDAEEGDMPSAKEKCWKFDMWLPRAIALAEGYAPEHPWWTVLADYSNADSGVTPLIYREQVRQIMERGLWEIYVERLKVLRIVYGMESNGVTLNQERLEQQHAEYTYESAKANRVCTNIAKTYGYDLVLPKGATNKSLSTFVFDVMKLEPVRNPKAKTDAPSLNKGSMEHYQATLPPRSRQLLFINTLQGKRKRDTAVSYMESYRRFWKPVLGATHEHHAISDEGTQDQNVLGLDEGKVRERIRTTPRTRGDASASSKLHTPQGGDSKGKASSTPLRQSSLRKPQASISGNTPDEHAGHDRQGSGRQGPGNPTSSSQGDGRGRTGDATTVRQRSMSSSRSVSKVRIESPASVRDRQETLLEASSLKGWYRLHPSLNPTGTDTLRWSSKDPNEQNISKQEGFNLRYMFGPAPGREWWSCDAKNIELRLPAYEAGETEMIELFERPNDPPFFGSYHMKIFATLHPEKFEKHGMACKDIYESTWYQWTKNGDFAVGYGSVEKSGTADRAYHIPGAFAQVKKLFKKIHGPGGLNERMIAFANEHGYVETMPDKNVCPEHGYPLMCTRSKWGQIKPTVPLNYHVQGTAMWWMMKAMIRCQDRLDKYNENRKLEFHAFMTMQVHDELVFDLPKSAVDPLSVKDWSTDKFNYLRTNLPLMRDLQKLMMVGGDDIGVPTPVSLKYHPVTWSEGFNV